MFISGRPAVLVVAWPAINVGTAVEQPDNSATHDNGTTKRR
jgi:hypothetical protein